MTLEERALKFFFKAQVACWRSYLVDSKDWWLPWEDLDHCVENFLCDTMSWVKAWRSTEVSVIVVQRHSFAFLSWILSAVGSPKICYWVSDFCFDVLRDLTRWWIFLENHVTIQFWNKSWGQHESAVKRSCVKLIHLYHYFIPFL